MGQRAASRLIWSPRNRSLDSEAEDVPVELIPLCRFTIRRGPRFDTGAGPLGRRVTAEIRELTVTGERLSGRMAGTAGADWATSAEDGLTVVDVRFTLQTDDDALILVTYGGRIDDLRKFPDISIYVAPVFTTGDPRYRWLAGIQAVAKGRFAEDPSVLIYDVYELR
jgi:hypothetical protein